MGGAISIKKNNESPVFNIFTNNQTTKLMFEEIASYGQRVEGLIGDEDKIELEELLLFVTKEINPQFTDAFVKNKEVIKQAFYFSMGSKKVVDMNLEQFRKLIPALLLFSHLYHIFDTADDASDGRIYKPAFMRAKQKVLDGRIEGVIMSDMSDENWANEFEVIHKAEGGEGGTGRSPEEKEEQGDEEVEDFISFGEFVAYTLKNIIRPAVYVADEGEGECEGKQVQEGGGDGGGGGNVDVGEKARGGRERESELSVSAFTKMMPDLIDGMDEKVQEEKELERSIRRIIRSMSNTQDAAAASSQEEEKRGGGEMNLSQDDIEKSIRRMLRSMSSTCTQDDVEEKGAGEEEREDNQDDEMQGLLAELELQKSDDDEDKDGGENENGEESGEEGLENTARKVIGP